ncbi:MAG: putative quinol monooxygenase [Acidimicrobiia bacterium]
MTVSVFASFHPRPEATAEFLEVMQVMVEETRQEAGCLRYDLFAAGGEGSGFHLFETYADSAALNVHRESDHYKEYRRRAPDLLSGPIGVIVLDPVDAQP